MIYALDTNVILDVLFRDEKFHEDSKTALERCSLKGNFIISPEVYSEMISAFSYEYKRPEEELDDFLERKQITLRSHTQKSLTKAGKGWKNNKTGGVQCSACGKSNSPECESCGSDLSWRNHIITDFMIGGHAEELANAIITRDSGYFENYFNLNIVDPSR
ncbi:MAG: type II toxin-antitoxin system VapC family toxin [Candidatus Nanohaloarchaea archaeon]